MFCFIHFTRIARGGGGSVTLHRINSKSYLHLIKHYIEGRLSVQFPCFNLSTSYSETNSASDLRVISCCQMARFLSNISQLIFYQHRPSMPCVRFTISPICSVYYRRISSSKSIMVHLDDIQSWRRIFLSVSHKCRNRLMKLSYIKTDKTIF